MARAPRPSPPLPSPVSTPQLAMAPPPQTMLAEPPARNFLSTSGMRAPRSMVQREVFGVSGRQEPEKPET